jgi:hypothetical protein
MDEDGRDTALEDTEEESHGEEETEVGGGSVKDYRKVAQSTVDAKYQHDEKRQSEDVDELTDVDAEVLAKREALGESGGRDFEDEKTEVKRHRDEVVVRTRWKTHDGGVGEGERSCQNSKERGDFRRARRRRRLTIYGRQQW